MCMYGVLLKYYQSKYLIGLITSIMYIELYRIMDMTGYNIVSHPVVFENIEISKIFCSNGY